MAAGRRTEPARPIRFVSLDKLQEHGSLPRYGSRKRYRHPLTGEPNAQLAEPREAFDAASTCFIFVSHRILTINSRDQNSPLASILRRSC